MRKTQKTGQESAPVASPVDAAQSDQLSWQEERFIATYLDNGGNATLAYRSAYPRASAETAAVKGSVWIRKDKIIREMDLEKARRRARSDFTRDEAILMLTCMARATIDDFTDVLRFPNKKGAYTGLGGKKFAIKEVSESFKNGNSIKLVDRMAVINELWEKLGLDQDASKQDRLSFLERFAGISAKLGRTGAGEGS